MFPRGEGFVDADSPGHDDAVHLAEVLRAAGGDELLGSAADEEGNLLPVVLQELVLVLVGELGELLGDGKVMTPPLRRSSLI